MDEEPVISVKHLSKDFKLPHKENKSVKNVFMNALSFGNKTFEVQHALHDVSFDIKKGDFFGIVGRNGNGDA